MGINALRFQAKAVYRGHGQRTDVENLEVSITAGTRAMGDTDSVTYKLRNAWCSY